MLQNLPGLRKSSEIPRAKAAKVAKLEIYFPGSFAPFACFARDTPNFGYGFTALGFLDADCSARCSSRSARN
jgi:hypothetical protein